MTQQPFSRPGAVDLSALTQTAAPAGGQPDRSGGAPVAGAGSSYAVSVDGEQGLQSVVEASMTAPVVLVFVSPSRVPESAQMADDLAVVVGEHEGKFLAAVVDVDASPAIAQMMQIQQVPLMMVLVDGRPATQPIPGVAGIDDLRAMFTQLAQQLTAQGIAGRHQPRSAAPVDGEGEDDEAAVDPRYAAAQAALVADDVDGAVAEYQKLVDANPADSEAAAGLAMAKVLQRTRGVDLQAAREAAAAHPDDVEAQTMAADLDLLGGHVDDAFARLVELVRRTSDKERDAAREHLLGLFGAVGNDDPRVLRGRQALASALF
ncbi:tetratricopeptide repeat protein [Nocardioides aestuarii]|uniref:Co-chaperone YbbN n=1 Tax=Nocardioides aestuarii TaxID=252231 RepID=A0ABW4TSJ5_9ACTN